VGIFKATSLYLSLFKHFGIFVLNPCRFPFMVGENMTSFKTLNQISRKCTSTTSVEPPWNSTNNSVVPFLSFFINHYYYSIWAIKTGFRTTYGSAYRRKRTGPCTVPITTCYFHVNGSIGIVKKIDFEIRPNLGCTTPKTSRKVVLDNPSVCLCVCPSVCLAVAFPASSHRRKV